MNVDVANSTLEERIKSIIHTEAPMRTVQSRTKYNRFISDSTKIAMAARDNARNTARATGQEVGLGGIQETTQSLY